MLLFVLIQGVTFSILRELGAQINLKTPFSSSTIVYLAIAQLISAVALLAIARVGNVPLARLGLRAPRGSFDVGWRALLPVGIVVIGPSALYASTGGGDVVAPGLSAMRALLFVALAICISVNEELWFRGLIVDRLGGAARPWLVVLGSSLLFGLPHVAASSASWLNAVGVTLAVGIPFAVVRLRCDSIVPLIAWHALIDIWAFVHTASVVPTGSPSAVEIAVGLAVPLALATGYLIWLGRLAREQRLA